MSRSEQAGASEAEEEGSCYDYGSEDRGPGIKGERFPQAMSVGVFARPGEMVVCRKNR